MGKKRAKKGTGTPRAARRKERKRRERIAVREKKVFRYKGYVIEELLELSREELFNLFPSRVRRTLGRGYNIKNLDLEKKILEARENEVVRTHARDHIVMPAYVGKTVAVYNGKRFINIAILPEMIGHYLGEFAITRKTVKHTGPGVGATRSSKFMPLK